MTRIRSYKIRQALLTVGTGLDPNVVLPEKLELYTPDGDPFDGTKDPTRMRFLEAWDNSRIYEPHDVVQYQDGLWIALDTTPVNQVPGVSAFWEPLLEPVDASQLLPSGGATGTLLTKQSSTNGDVVWAPAPKELPAGGVTGELLAKASDTDQDVNWVPAPVSEGTGLPAGGLAAEILTKNSSTDGDASWAAPAPQHDLPVGGSIGQVLAKTSAADRVVGWTAPTPRDMPVGGSTGQVLTKNSATDRDTGWATPSSGGGGSGVADSVYLDERFTTDNKGLYTLSGAGQALAWDSTLGGWIYPAAAGGGLYDRNDSHSDNLRNVLVAIEVQLGSAGGGTPLFSLIMRRQSDRFIMLQAANTSITVYTTSPSGGTDVNRASTVAGLGAGGLQRGWLVASVYENTVIGWWGNVHPLQGALHASGGGSQARVVADLTGLAEFNADANRTGRADRIRIGSGSSDITGHRIYRHLIIDLDKALPV